MQLVMQKAVCTLILVNSELQFIKNCKSYRTALLFVFCNGNLSYKAFKQCLLEEIVLVSQMFIVCFSALLKPRLQRPCGY